MKDAINDGYLTDYCIVVPIIKESNKDSLTQSRIKKELLVRLLEEHSVFSYVLAYCNSIAEANEFNQMLNDANITSSTFNSTTSLVERERILEEFKIGNIRVLSTVYTLSEGVDIPEANTCMFVEPRNSEINVTQCVGRILRLHPDKTLSYVILPANDEVTELEKFVKIMSKNDSRLKRDVLSKKRGRVCCVKIGINKDQGNINNEDDEKEDDEEEDEEDEQIEMSIYNRFGELMIGMEDRLRSNIEKFQEFMNTYNGKQPSETNKNIEENRLGIQIQHYKQNYKNKKHNMRDENCRKMWEEFVKINNISLVLLTSEDRLRSNIEKLQEFMNTYNGKRPSETSKNIEEKRLGIQFSLCKQNYKNKKHNMRDGKNLLK
jgi:superfamily II DNA or RNA helicase